MQNCDIGMLSGNGGFSGSDNLSPAASNLCSSWLPRLRRPQPLLGRLLASHDAGWWRGRRAPRSRPSTAPSAPLLASFAANATLALASKPKGVSDKELAELHSLVASELCQHGVAAASSPS